MARQTPSWLLSDSTWPTAPLSWTLVVVSPYLMVLSPSLHDGSRADLTCAVLCCAVLCCAVLCCAVLCRPELYAVLCCAVLFLQEAACSCRHIARALTVTCIRDVMCVCGIDTKLMLQRQSHNCDSCCLLDLLCCTGKQSICSG